MMKHLIHGISITEDFCSSMLKELLCGKKLLLNKTTIILLETILVMIMPVKELKGLISLAAVLLVMVITVLAVMVVWNHKEV